MSICALDYETVTIARLFHILPWETALNTRSAKLLGWLKVIIGGPLGLLAWGISGASAVAVIIWGLKTVALPLLMLKTASWSIWGFGVFRESKAKLKSK
ncbi:hypothetical protein [Methylococcus sp. EFPC2]|uniref:hypothetical protein n=1 Tax=Methylococcus sp. EFPC2 TaxID=2812648 RepID=UPI001967F366|nr:hypothetical protein [Methylococcus sp. EFPC2]QSA95467.1 hypothetical protein JWZ97_09355 [Methylococcus sp. EFPC2]